MTPEQMGWVPIMGFEDSFHGWRKPDGSVVQDASEAFQVVEWDDANPTRVRTAPSDASGNVTGPMSGWSGSTPRGGDGGFLSETFGGTIDGARDFVTSPEFALVAGGGLAGNYALTGNLMGAAAPAAASGGTVPWYAQAGGTMTDAPVYDTLANGGGSGPLNPYEFWDANPYSGAQGGWENIGNEVYGSSQGALPPGVTITPAGAAQGLSGAAALQALSAGDPGNQPMTTEQAAGIPKGYQLPDGSTVYGTPSSIADAAQRGLLPGITGAAALKNLLGNDFIKSGLGAGSSSLGRLLGLGQTGMDALSVGGNLAGTALGMYGANQQADSFRRLSDDAMTRWNQSMAIGAPSRERYEGSFQPGFTMANDPGYTDALNSTAKGVLHGLSVNGNPSSSPNAWNQSLEDVMAKTAYPALQNYRTMNANTGGFTGFASAGARGPDTDAAVGAIKADSNVLNAVGSGIADLTTPRNTLEQALRALNGNGNIFNYG